MRDVPLGRPLYYRWVEAGPIIARPLQNQQHTGIVFDAELAAAQHAEMVRDEDWEAQVAPVSREFVRMDGLVVPLAPKLLVACVEALEDWLVAWLRGRGFDFIEVGYDEARKLGVNLVSLGDARVLAMKGSEQPIGQLRPRNFEVFAPDMSMFTLGGGSGGVHCLCQALRRDAVDGA